MTDEYLLDVVHALVTDGTERDITLGLRPAVPLRVTALAGGWRTMWAGPRGRHLHGVHRATVPATLTAMPGRGPSDDPASPVIVGEWTAHAQDVHFISVYAPDKCGEVADVELVPGDGGALRSVRVHLAQGTTIEHEVGL